MFLFNKNEFLWWRGGGGGGREGGREWYLWYVAESYSLAVSICRYDLLANPLRAHTIARIYVQSHFPR